MSDDVLLPGRFGGYPVTLAAFKKPSAVAPILMSVAALALVVAHVSLYGAAREADEGTAAHLWQLLMACQVPVAAVYAVRWLPQYGRQALLVIVAQVVAALAALAPVFILGL